MAKQKKLRSKKRRLSSKQKKAKQKGDPFWKGVETEDDPDKIKFLDWLGQITQNSTRRNFTDTDYFFVHRMAQQGLVKEQMAHILGLSPSVFSKMVKEDEKMKLAIESGKAFGVQFASERLMDKIAEGNVSAIMFFLKIQGGWNERRILELESHVSESDVQNQTALLEHLTDEELQDLQRILDKANSRHKNSRLLEGQSYRVNDDQEDDSED